MPRICGVDLPKDKKIGIALTYIYGIGRTTACKVLKVARLNSDTRAKDLTEEEVSRLSAVISKDYKIEGDLRREVLDNVKRLTEISCYRGVRHRKGLPVRGQRTHTNARTRKGPRRTVGVMRRGKTMASREAPKE